MAVDQINIKVNETTFLGVVVDKELSWRKQISHIENKISKGIGMLAHIRKFVDEDALVQVYNSLLLPYLNYCVEVWGNTHSTKLNKIVTLQKRAIRIIAGLNPRESTSKYFKRLNLLKFSDVVKYHTCVYMYKCTI